MDTSNAAVCIVCRETLTVDCMPGLFGPGFTCRRCGEKTRRNLSNPDAAVARAAKATSKAAAALGRLGGKAGRGESQRRGDSDHYRAIRAQRKARTLGGVRVLRTRVHEAGGLYRWAIWTEDGQEYRDGGNYATREAAKVGLRAALDPQS